MSKQSGLHQRVKENAAEINRLHECLHEAFRRRNENGGAMQRWSAAAKELHARWGQLALPGGPFPNFLERVAAGEPEMAEIALAFLEVRPYFFRSGYMWKDIFRRCKRAPLLGEQAERRDRLVAAYVEWKRVRRLSSERGAAVRREILPLLVKFHHLFPIRPDGLSEAHFEGIATVGDLYRLLCSALRVEAKDDPENLPGTIHEPCRAKIQADMTIWAREYGEWREAHWTPGDVWATLAFVIAEVYKLDSSFQVSSGTRLPAPKAKSAGG
ncbi:MAG: hypothetical protein WBQ94_25925 [Terracidiphilus sp.]